MGSFENLCCIPEQLNQNTWAETGESYPKNSSGDSSVHAVAVRKHWAGSARMDSWIYV